MTKQEIEIQREAEACRKAFAGSKVGDVVQHCHHELWLEVLSEPAENRIAFILSNKSPDEQAERLRRFRPFDWKKADADWKKADADWKKADADWKKAYADCEKAYADCEKADADWKKAGTSPQMLALHKEVCGCPWDGHGTDIFGH